MMAHESFENDSIAKLMNSNFVNIKVDREERPDSPVTAYICHDMICNVPAKDISEFKTQLVRLRT